MGTMNMAHEMDRLQGAVAQINNRVGEIVLDPEIYYDNRGTLSISGHLRYSIWVGTNKICHNTDRAVLNLVRHRTLVALQDMLDQVAVTMIKLGYSNPMPFASLKPTPPVKLVQGL